MSLNARSIAVRGFGYGALAVATAGFILDIVVTPPIAPSTTTSGVVITRRDRRHHPKWNELYR
ncbi:MAG TPA: hypothetical protein VIH29_09010 [Gallionella sp.]